MEMVKSDWVAIRKSPPWAIDSWGLGTVVFMPCLFSLEIICSSTLCPLECNSFTKALYFLFAGCLIYELFSGSKLAKTEELRNTVGIPKVLFSSLSFLGICYVPQYRVAYTFGFSFASSYLWIKVHEYLITLTPVYLELILV